MDNLFILAVIIVMAVALVRWGGFVFLAYACVHFIVGQWFEAGMAFVIGLFLMAVRGIALWLANRSPNYQRRGAAHRALQSWR